MLTIGARFATSLVRTCISLHPSRSVQPPVHGHGGIIDTETPGFVHLAAVSGDLCSLSLFVSSWYIFLSMDVASGMLLSTDTT